MAYEKQVNKRKRIKLQCTYTLVFKYLTIQVWDCSGKSRFIPVVSNYFKGANVFVLCYDICNQSSFDSLVIQWYRTIVEKNEQTGMANVMLVLVGLKSDLQQQRKVQLQEAIVFAEQNKMAYIEVSAKNDSNCELVFYFTALAGMGELPKDIVGECMTRFWNFTE